MFTYHWIFDSSWFLSCSFRRSTHGWWYGHNKNTAFTRFKAPKMECGCPYKVTSYGGILKKKERNTTCLVKDSFFFSHYDIPRWSCCHSLDFNHNYGCLQFSCVTVTAHYQDHLHYRLISSLCVMWQVSWLLTAVVIHGMHVWLLKAMVVCLMLSLKALSAIGTLNSSSTWCGKCLDYLQQ